MEKEKDRYKIIDEGSGRSAESRMNELAEKGYRFVEMRTAGTNVCNHITIIMEKVESE